MNRIDPSRNGGVNGAVSVTDAGWRRFRRMLPSGVLVFAVLMAFSVTYTQAQSSDSPRRKPSGLGPMPNDPATSSRKTDTGRFSDRAKKKDSQGNESDEEKKEGGEPGQNGEPQPPGPRTEEGKKSDSGKEHRGTTAVGPRVGGKEGTTPPGAPGLPGQAPEAAAGPGLPGMALPTASTTVSVQGGTEGATYEPAYEHDLEYPDVPDTAAESTLTEEGPMAAQEFLSIIHMTTEWNIISTDAANKVMLNFYIANTTPKQALLVLKKHDLYYDWDEENNFLFVMTKDEYLAEQYAKVSPTPEEFKVVHADVTYVESMLSSLLSKVGRMVTDQRTNNIYVWDTPDNITQMRKTFEEVDVPLEKREFTVTYSDLADVEAAVALLLTANGTTLSDPRTGQLIVWDSPTALDRVAETITRLDVPVEPVTYEVKYMNAEDLIDSLEVLLSERGLIQVDPRYNTLVVTDLPSRQERIGELIKTLDRELETRTWVIKFADLDFIADQIETYIPSEMGEVVVNDLVHQITVSGLPERLEKIDELIETWDIKRRQVMIEAFLVDMGESVARSLNVKWSYFTNDDGAPIAINAPTGGFTGVNSDMVTVGQLPYAVPLYGNLELDDAGEIVRPLLKDIEGNTIIDHYAGNNLAVAINYLDKTSDVTLLAAPRVTVQDGEEAIFENAERVPYASASTSYGGYSYGYSGGSTSRVEFVDVGIILRVKPVITDSDDVLLDIAAEDSSAELVEIESFTTGTTDSTSTRKAPQVKARNVETQLRIHSGDTVVMGGLRQGKSTKDVNRVPILGDIPVIGRVFRSPSKAASDQTLMIFLTPTIVDEHTFPETDLLARADENIAKGLRHMSKGFAGRIRDQLGQGKDEIGISVGQGGQLFSEGRGLSIAEFQEVVSGLENPGKVKVIIRRHPRAPESVITELLGIAKEANVRVEFDTTTTPLVPAFTYLPPHVSEPAPEGGVIIEPNAAATPEAEATPEAAEAPEAPVLDVPPADVPAEEPPAAEGAAPEAAPATPAAEEVSATEAAPVELTPVEPAAEEAPAAEAPAAEAAKS